MESMMKVMHIVKEKLPDDKKQLVDELLINVKELMQNPHVESMKSKPEYKFFPPFNSDIVEWEWDNWAPRNGDVLIASYPKTGTTWLREIARQISFFGDEEQLKISSLVIENPFLAYLEAGSKVKFDIMDSLPLKKRVWGTHLAAELINIEKMSKSGLKIIYVMRNPKDMIVSMKNFFGKIPWLNSPNMKEYFPSDFQGFMESVTTGKMPMQMKCGEWYPHHVRSWLKYKGQSNFHFVFYEEMKKDPQSEITRLAQFLDAPLSQEQIAQVVSATSFDSMKKASQSLDKELNFFRKGGVGNWKQHFTVAQSEYIDEKMKEDMGDVNVEWIYQL